jgi:hypothetical protein
MISLRMRTFLYGFLPYTLGFNPDHYDWFSFLDLVNVYEVYVDVVIIEVQIWIPLPLLLTRLVYKRIWLVNRIYETHLIG